MQRASNKKSPVLLMLCWRLKWLPLLLVRLCVVFRNAWNWGTYEQLEKQGSLELFGTWFLLRLLTNLVNSAGCVFIPASSLRCPRFANVLAFAPAEAGAWRALPRT